MRAVLSLLMRSGHVQDTEKPPIWYDVGLGQHSIVQNEVRVSINLSLTSLSQCRLDVGMLSCHDRIQSESALEDRA